MIRRRIEKTDSVGFLDRFGLVVLQGFEDLQKVVGGIDFGGRGAAVFGAVAALGFAA